MSTEPVSFVKRAIRAILVTTGILAFGLALVPGGPSLVPVRRLVAVAGNEYFAVGLVGALGLLILVWMVLHRLRSGVSHASLPDPETPQQGPTPGDEVDAVLTMGRLGQLVSTDLTREELRERLQLASCRAAGQRPLLTGTGETAQLPNEPLATESAVATYLTEGSTAVSASRRVWGWVTGDLWELEQSKTAVRALVDSSGIDTPKGGDE